MEGEFWPPLPAPVLDNTPEDITIYSDGRNSSLVVADWALFGADCFHPGRDLSAQPWGAEELALGDPAFLPNGCGLHFALGGSRASSTPTEVARLILALLRPGAVHVGVDNATVVRWTQAILDGCPHATAGRWGLTPDGDLWELVEACILSKGRHAVRVSKVRGHATDTEVCTGIVRLCDQLGNKAADDLAAIATDNRDDLAFPLMVAFRRRQEAYSALVSRIQALIRRTLRAGKRLRDDKRNAEALGARLAEEDVRVLVSRLCFGGERRAKALVLGGRLSAQRRLVADFLSFFMWEPVQPGEAGLT